MHGDKSDRYRPNPTELNTMLYKATVLDWSGKQWCISLLLLPTTRPDPKPNFEDSLRILAYVSALLLTAILARIVWIQYVCHMSYMSQSTIKTLRTGIVLCQTIMFVKQYWVSIKALRTQKCIWPFYRFKKVSFHEFSFVYFWIFFV